MKREFDLDRFLVQPQPKELCVCGRGGGRGAEWMKKMRGEEMRELQREMDL
jgi:hypothetical protein